MAQLNVKISGDRLDALGKYASLRPALFWQPPSTDDIIVAFITSRLQHRSCPSMYFWQQTRRRSA
jgi:hypothetical protein